MPSNIKPMLTSQPPDLIEAAKAEAKRREQSLSAFVGDCIRRQIPREVRETLDERPVPGRPWPKKDKRK